MIAIAAIAPRSARGACGSAAVRAAGADGNDASAAALSGCCDEGATGTGRGEVSDGNASSALPAGSPA